MTPNEPQQPFQYQPWMTPPAYTPEPKRRSRRGIVAVAVAATLAAGGLGGTAGALIGAAQADQVASQSGPASASPASVNTPTDVSSVVAKVTPSVVQVNVTM